MSHIRTRRHFSAEQKAAIVRRHLGGRQPISKRAEELGVQPSLIRNWVNQVLAQAEKAFEKTSENHQNEKLRDRRIEQLQAKLVNRNEVIAELMEANVLGKKKRGNSEKHLGSPRYSR